jgi:hypothetical protein
MKLFLSSESNMKSLNKEFQREFSFLRLALYDDPHKPKQSSIIGHKVSDHTQLKHISDLVPAYILIEPSDTVNEVEQKFQNRYGLPVQIFRKSGDTWVETAQTDNLTLEKQNDMGAASVYKPNFNINTLFL